MTCENAVGANPDVSGAGVMSGFLLQNLFVYLLATLSSYYNDKLQWGAHFDREYGKKQDISHDVLLFASDTQIFNGIALMISSLSQINRLSLYSLHLVHAMVFNTGLINTVTILLAFKRHKGRFTTRVALVILFMTLFLAFSICYGLQLSKLENSPAGQCHEKFYLDFSSKDRGKGGLVWVVVSSVIFHVMLGYSLYRALRKASLWDTSTPHKRITCFIQLFSFLGYIFFFLQFIALKIKYEHLEESTPENGWGFGQVVAVVLAWATFFRCCEGYREWREWKRNPVGDEEESIGEGAAISLNEVAPNGSNEGQARSLDEGAANSSGEVTVGKLTGGAASSLSSGEANNLNGVSSNTLRDGGH